MKVDIHNHTALCNHAEGEMEQYIQKAIENSTLYFGFSDHAPMNFDEKYRMSFEQMGTYEQNVKELKEKYRDKLTILLGYEVDYLENFMDKRVLDAKVDFLVGSVHFINRWGFDNPEFIGEYKNRDIDEIWLEYFKAVEDMTKSGKFDIVGHIDLIKVFDIKPKKSIKSIVSKTIKEIKKANLTVELNSAGLRKPCKEIYPGDEIMELLAEHDIPITFSSDAHKPEQVGFKSEELIKKAKEFGYEKCAVFFERDRKLINF